MSNFYQVMIEKNIHFIRTPGQNVLIGHISKKGFEDCVIDLNNTGVKLLPDSLVVYGSLILKGCDIHELPSELTVLGSLDIRGTQIVDLPNDLTVGGDIFTEDGCIECDELSD